MNANAPGQAEYDCEGCGVHVISFGYARVSSSGLCSLCEWLCEHIPDPVLMEDFRRRQGLLDDTRVRRAR